MSQIQRLTTEQIKYKGEIAQKTKNVIKQTKIAKEHKFVVVDEHKKRLEGWKCHFIAEHSPNKTHIHYFCECMFMLILLFDNTCEYVNMRLYNVQ